VLGSAAILAALQGCAAPAEEEIGGLIKDRANARLSLRVDLAPLSAPALEDFELAWREVVTDLFGAPFEAARETQQVEYLSPVSLDAASMTERLILDRVRAQDVEYYGWLDGNGPYPSMTTAFLQSRTQNVDASTFTPDRVWLLVLRDEVDRIRLIVHVQNSPDTTPSLMPFAVAEGSSALDATLALDGLSTVPVTDSTLALSWVGLETGADGAPFDASVAERVRIAPLDELEADGVEDWFALSAVMDSAPGLVSLESGGATSVGVPDGVRDAEGGARFLAVIDCADCEATLPGAIVVLQRE
jgi:hypothetical protein